MEEKSLRNNYVVTLIKLFLFFILLCFIIELTKSFFREAKNRENFNAIILVSSVFFSFFFYNFIADMRGPYKNIQMFFFRSAFISYLFPFLLIVSGFTYFILPKILSAGFAFDRNIFVFVGGFIFTSHLIYIAGETRGKNFADYVNYFFTLSILYIFNAILIGLYFKIAYSFSLSQIIIDGVKNGALLIRSMFMRTF